MEVNVVDEPKLKKYKQNPEVEWCNLPSDLLSSIISKLYFADRIRFRSVCKDWHNTPVGDRPINELPWVISHTEFHSKNVESKVMLSDPVNMKTIKIPNFNSIFNKYFDYYFSHSRICASKSGWVLFAKFRSMFLYSPFKNHVITLPTLSTSFRPFDDVCYYDRAAFSSTNNTSSLDCVFVLICYDDPAGLRFFTYCSGDSDWRIKLIAEEKNSGNSRVTSLFCNEQGVCYFVLRNGKLGAFCVESQECTWLVNSVWDRCGNDSLYLVELNGDLLLAKCSPTYNDWKVFRYDVNERGWIKQKTLGNIALFVCSGCTYLRPAIGNIAYLANKIIVFRLNLRGTKEIRVYSMKDGSKLYQESKAYSWMVEDLSQKAFIEPPYEGIK